MYGFLVAYTVVTRHASKSLPSVAFDKPDVDHNMNIKRSGIIARYILINFMSNSTNQ